MQNFFTMKNFTFSLFILNFAKKMSKFILGLDVSTTTIGISIFKTDDDYNNGKVVILTHVSPKVNKNIKGIESLFLKKQIFEEEFLCKYKDFGITDVVIEEPLLRSNNVNTCATLLRFNGMISDSIYQRLNIVPTYISSYDARKFAFPYLLSIRKYNKQGVKCDAKTILSKIEKSKSNGGGLTLFASYKWDIDKKRVIFDNINQLFPNIEWLYNKKGELKKENFDMSDAICVILAYINQTKGITDEARVLDYHVAKSENGDIASVSYQVSNIINGQPPIEHTINF